ncbi:MAG: beta-CASP ribonuclease aCPSF1 [Candidatus Aenigmatarchaeota archaeon]
MVEQKTVELFERIKQMLPSNAEITDIRFEACEIIIYTKNKEFFVDPGEKIKEIVNTIKKRIILRPDPSITKDPETVEKIIKEIIPPEAGLKAIDFEPEFSKVIIEVEKPGVAIGKSGEILKEIKKQTFWAPSIKRTPLIPNDIIKTLRELIHAESSFRKEFLDSVGRRIHSGWKGTDWVRITALGACREVGRSAILVQTPESNVLLDCGIKPGSNEFPFLNAPELNIQSLDAIVIGHAHLDHVGALPFLYERGYTGPVYMTAPTRDIMVMLCMDYIDIMQKEGKSAPYTTKGIKEAVRHSITLDYGEVSDITPDMRLTFGNAGHILGSSLIHLHIGEGLHNILYTSDFKFDRTALYDPASTDFSRVETLITESTYGGTEDKQPKRAEAEQMLIDTINKILEKKGKVLIPSFAVERAQDIIAILGKHNLEVPIYLDGMLWDATAIHTAYPEFLSKELQKAILTQGDNPFMKPNLKRVGSVDERNAVLESKEPCIILATSGMLIGGPVMNYLAGIAENKKNALIFVSYQAENTLGKKIQKGWREVPVVENGKTIPVPIKCEVITIPGLSGHSDRTQLMNYVGHLRQKPQKVICVHGEESKCLDLAKSIHKTYKCETIAPKALDAIRLV